jgi:hypothetical protein
MRWAARSLAACCLWSAAVAGAQEAPAPAPASPLKACASICDPGERLVCYDRLAAQEPPRQAPSASGAPGAPGAPSPAPNEVAPGAPGHAPAEAVPAAGSPAKKESFGLYAVEHPAPPPPPKSMTARIIGIGASPDGRSTVELEGGQLWLLDELDPLLAKGDSVTIERAAFGSFLLTTAKGRTHRVHRLH